jgi:hypothetical protein
VPGGLDSGAVEHGDTACTVDSSTDGRTGQIGCVNGCMVPPRCVRTPPCMAGRPVCVDRDDWVYVRSVGSGKRGDPLVQVGGAGRWWMSGVGCCESCVVWG